MNQAKHTQALFTQPSDIPLVPRARGMTAQKFTKRPETAALGKGKAGPFPATVPQVDRKISPNVKSDSLSLNCLYNWVYAEYLLSLWESGILVHARQRVPTWLTPNRNPELPGYGQNFPGVWHFTMLSQLVAGKIKCSQPDSINGGFLETCTWFPPDTVHVPFPFVVLLCILSL